MKELTKAKDVNQFRRKVIVNGHAVPDAIVEKAEDLAGPIHPGSYWYDCASSGTILSCSICVTRMRSHV
jgi:hypothetical protein